MDERYLDFGTCGGEWNRCRSLPKEEWRGLMVARHGRRGSPLHQAQRETGRPPLLPDQFSFGTRAHGEKVL